MSFFIDGAGLLNRFVGSDGVTIAFPLPTRPGVKLELVTAPVLSGTGRIGSALVYTPAVWSGTPPAVMVEWLRDTVPIEAAAGLTSYTPVAGDDFSQIVAREFAVNSYGAAEAYSAAVAITRVSPVATGSLSNRTYAQGAGLQIIDVAALFSGDALMYASTGVGQSIDPATGLLSISTDHVRAGSTVQVTAANSGGSANLSFAVTVNVAAPTLTGAGIANQSYTQGSGTQFVSAAPAFAGTGLVFGISGGTGISIDAGTGVISVPTGSLYSAQTITVSATNASGTIVTTTFTIAVVAVTGSKPGLSGTAIAAQSRTHKAADIAVAAAGAFTGTVASYSVSGGTGVTINSSTGLLTISAAVAHPSQTVTVRATNAFGSTDITFPCEVIVPALSAGQWRVYLDYEPAATGFDPTRVTWHIEIIAGPALGATGVCFRGLGTVDGATVGAGWHVCRPHPTLADVWVIRGGNAYPSYLTPAWIAANSANPTYNVLNPPQTKDHMAIYTLETGATDAASFAALPFSPASNVITQLMTIEQPASATGSKSVIMFSPSEKAVAGYEQGDCGQFLHDLAQCRAYPDVLACFQDTSGGWLSLTFGALWLRPARDGLKTYQTMGGWIDHVNPKRVFVHGGGSYPVNSAYQGLYLSTDGMLSFTRRYTTNFGSRRGTYSAIGGAPSSAVTSGDASTHKTMRMFAFLGNEINDTIKHIMSVDAGVSWTDVQTLSKATYGDARYLEVDPTDQNRVWLATSTGLWLFAAANAAGAGTNLRSGAVSAPPYVSAAGTTIICGAGGRLYKSTNGKAGTPSFAQVGSESGFHKAHVNPWDPDHIVLTYNNGPDWPKFSINGSTFTRASTLERRPGVGGANPGHQFSYVKFHPDHSGRAYLIASCTNTTSSRAFYRTENFGEDWDVSCVGYNGSQFKVLAPAPQLVDPTNESRIYLPEVDFAGRLSLDGGLSWAENTRGSAASWDQSGSKTEEGGAIHPDPSRRTILAILEQETAANRLAVTVNDGASWAWAGPAGAEGPFVGFDQNAPANAYWGRNVSRGHGAAGTWSLMSGLPSGWAVMGMTWKEAGQQAVFALDIGLTNSKFKRSIDRGDSWQDILTMPHDQNISGGKYGPFAAHPSNRDILFTRGSDGRTMWQWDLASGSSPTTRSHTVLNPYGAGNSPPVTPFEIKLFDVDARFPLVRYILTNHAGSAHRFFRCDDGGAGSGAWDNLSEKIPTCCNINGLLIGSRSGFVLVSGSNGVNALPPPYGDSPLFDALPYGPYLQTEAWSP